MKKALSGVQKKSVVALCSLCLLCFQAVVAASAAMAQGAVTYTVQKGDTLYAISRKYGVSVDELCKANGMSSSSVIKVGQRLSIPSATPAAPATERRYDIYTVQKGDTLYRIATINNISVDELKALNTLTNASLLKVGQQLKIPLTVVDPADSGQLTDLLPDDPRSYSTKKGDSSLEWPVKNPVVTYTKGKVSGVQLSAQKSEPVTAIRAGTVMYVGNYRGYGQVVFVQSKTGHIYAYSGLGSIAVKKGEYVVFGDTLGTAGVDAITGSSQIMLMVYQKSNPIDPAKAPRG